jgi:MYXO-CTERM domain-containing protein
MIDFGTVFTGSHNSIIVQLILQANGTLDSFTDDGTILSPQEDVGFPFKPISFDYEQDGPDGSTATYQTEVNWDHTSNGPGQATFIQAYSADYADPEASISIIGTSVAETPLPTALPLFATGLAVLGLLGWRRRRKATALAAA